MTDHALNDSRQRRIRRRLRQRPAFTGINTDVKRPARQRRRRVLATLDRPMLATVILLLAIGSLMVFSATFDWSNETYGTAAGFFMQEHLRNVLLGSCALIVVSFVDYRFWKRFAVWMLVFTIVALIAVILFGEDRFGARRAFSAGRFQPSELAEFTIVLYLSAWLGSRNARVGSFLFGFLPFVAVVAVIAYPIYEQPDLSSATIVVLTAGVIFFVAGANLAHLAAVGGIATAAGFFVVERWPYAQQRIANYFAGLSDVTLIEYQTQQAITAFLRGGWFGVGFGESQQKFGALPAPHTDSIFAVIGEELGVMGAALVVALYIVFAIRGFQIARIAKDSFGALLCVGFTSWVIIQALLNIAVMTGAIPSTGVPLPFISFGGSSLMVVMIGVGLMLSVHRVATRRTPASERRSDIAHFDRSWRNRRSRVSRAGNRPGPAAQKA